MRSNTRAKPHRAFDLLPLLGRSHPPASLASVAFSITLTSCAGLNVYPVNPDNDPPGHAKSDLVSNGIRYYEPASFLLVYTDKAGSVKTEFLTLPDTTRKVVAEPHSFLAKNKQTLDFNDGMLVSNLQTVDSTIVPAAIIDAVKTSAEAALKAAAIANAPSTPQQRLQLSAPRLYKIVVHGSTVTLLGSSAGDTIILPITP